MVELLFGQMDMLKDLKWIRSFLLCSQRGRPQSFCSGHSEFVSESNLT